MSSEAIRVTALDRIAGWVSPKWGANRLMWRTTQHMAEASVSAYRGATRTRLDRGWSGSTSATGVPILDHAGLEKMRDRSRQLDRNHMLASSMLNRCVDNIIGEGMKLQATTTDEDFNKRLEDKWHDYWEMPDKRGILSGPEIERMAYRAQLRDGDVGCALMRDGKLGMVEGDLISSPLGSQADTNMRDGVELNRNGRPIAFHLLTADAKGRTTSKRARIAANDFVYLPRLKRLNGVRGVPAFQGSFWAFDQVDGYIEAVVTASRMAAIFGLLIKKNNSTSAFTNLSAADGGADAAAGRRKMEMQPGMVEFLDPGEEVHQVDPKQPAGNFDSMVLMMVRLLGLELALPLELALLDFSKTNFSSARASLIQAYRSFRIQQAWWKTKFMRRIYRWRVSKWILSGELPDLDDPWRHKWIAQPWQFLDPVKEMQGKAMEMDFGMSTQAELLMEQGKDIREWRQGRGAELLANAEANIPALRSSQAHEVTRPDDETESRIAESG